MCGLERVYRRKLNVDAGHCQARGRMKPNFTHELSAELGRTWRDGGEGFDDDFRVYSQPKPQRASSRNCRALTYLPLANPPIFG